MELLLSQLAENPKVAVVITVLAGLVVAGQTYIALTPTQDDDKWYAKVEAMPIIGPLLKGLAAFAPIQRKEKKK